MTAREMIDQRLNAKNKNAALVGCIQEIRNIPDIHTLNEAQAKLKIIQRILSLLDWDIYRDIDPEHGLEARKSVDYTLQVSGKNKVFIEAKSPKEDLEKKKYQEQLFNYSVQKNPDLAILTNGILWWLYLPRAEGDWDDRKFYTIDILKQEIEDIVDKFSLLLSRENVASGEAVQHAESILKSRQREKIVKENLPEAWNKVIKNAVSPNSLLVDLLVETAEEVCGFKLENGEILRFIRSHQEKWLLPASKQEVPPPTQLPAPKTKRQTRNQTNKPKRMQIDGESHELKYKYDILVNTANWLIDRGYLKPSDCPVKLTSRAKIYFINRMPERAPDLKFWRPQKLKNGLFIEADRSDKAIENTQKLLKKYGYDPEILKIE